MLREISRKTDRLSNRFTGERRRSACGRAFRFNRIGFVLLLIIGGVVSARAAAPAPIAMPRPPRSQAARMAPRYPATVVGQWVYATVSAPRGVTVAFFGQGGKEHAFAAPGTVGLRAWRRFPFVLHGIADTERSYYGTVEVLYAHRYPKGAEPADLAIPIHFDDQDVRSLRYGRMVTKYLVMEDPRFALPEAAGPNGIVVHDVSISGAALDLARQLGKITMVVRIGDRIPTRAELASVREPDSILLARRVRVSDATGAERISRAYYVGADTGARPIRPVGFSRRGRRPARRRAPCGPQCGPYGCDVCSNQSPPMLPPMGDGPAIDYREAYLCDGGDSGLKAWSDKAGALLNIEPGDTVASYTDNLGAKRIAESNQACVYAPRYAEVRLMRAVEGFNSRRLARAVAVDQVKSGYSQLWRNAASTGSGSLEAVGSRMRASGFDSDSAPVGFSEITLLEGAERITQWSMMDGAIGPIRTDGATQPLVASKVVIAHLFTSDQHAQILGRILGTGELVEFKLRKEVVADLPPIEKPSILRLVKRATVANAPVGGEVGFEITYVNTGDRAIANVAVVDSLPPRLEYVPQSAQSSRKAIFSAQANDSGSETLRWELEAPLGPRETGTVRFMTRVR